METVHLFLADIKLNKMMKAFDLCEPYKSFVSTEILSFKGRKIADKDFASKLINTEMTGTLNRFRVDGVVVNNKLFVRKGLKMLSNGNEILIVNHAHEV